MSNRFFGVRSALALVLLALASFGPAVAAAHGWHAAGLVVAGVVYLSLALGTALAFEKLDAPMRLGSIGLAGQFVVLLVAAELSRGYTLIAIFGPLSLGVLYPTRVTRWVVIALSSLVVCHVMFRFAGSVGLAFQGLLGMAAFGTFVVSFAHLARSRYEARAELSRVNDVLRGQSDQIADLAAERERLRIAREIHDSVGHWLTSVHVHLETALASEGESRRGAIEHASRANREALQEVRRSVRAMRSSHEPRQTLTQSLQDLMRESQRAGLKADLLIDDPGPLPSATRLALYRIAQEALTNVRRHADAEHVELQLVRRAGRLILTVVDDGCGFDPESVRVGDGLRGARERAIQLGGEFTIRSKAGRGALLRVEVAAS